MSDWYWFNPEVGSDANPGTFRHPFKTRAKALQAALRPADARPVKRPRARPNKKGPHGHVLS